MKYLLVVIPVGLLLIGAGCQRSGLSQQPVNQTVAPTPVVTEQVNFKAVPGQRFGEMTFEKVDGNFATFSGTSTVSGRHFTSELDGNLCFTPDYVSFLKLPDLRKGDSSAKQFCFSNQELAKKLLGTGEGKATVTISGYGDMVIDTSQTPQSELVKVESKQ